MNVERETDDKSKAAPFDIVGEQFSDQALEAIANLIIAMEAREPKGIRSEPEESSPSC